MWRGDDVAPSPAEQPKTERSVVPGVAAPGPAAADRAKPAPGGSIVIKGELKASEDLTIEGQVEGKIELLQNVLTIGPSASTKAELFAKSVVVIGEVVGNITASEKVEIRQEGSVEGDITAPRVAIADGAIFRGRVDMTRQGARGADLSGLRRTEPEATAPPRVGMTAR